MSAVPEDMDLPPKPDDVTNGQLYLLLNRIHAQQLIQRAQIATLENEFREYKRQQEDLVRTWSAAKTMINMIKLLGAVALALGAIYAVAKGIASHFIPFPTNGSTPP